MPELLAELSKLKEWAFADAGALAALVSVPVALLVLLETVKLRRVETDPEITIFLQLRRGSAFLVELIVKNVGRGQAFDITFKIEPDEPFWRNWGFSSMPMFEKGLKHMAPGQEIRVLVGTFMEIRKEPYTVVASYCGKERRFRKRLAFTDTYTLDVRQFDGQFEITEDRTVKALDKIASETKRVAQGVREISTILSPPSPLRPPSPMPEGVESGDSQTPPWQIDRHLPVRVAKLIGGALGMKYRQDGD